MPAGGPPNPKNLRAGKQSRTGRMMRNYFNSQIWLPPLDEDDAWAENEKLFPGEK